MVPACQNSPPINVKMLLWFHFIIIITIVALVYKFTNRCVENMLSNSFESSYSILCLASGDSHENEPR